jgi:flavorubredoxin
MTGCALSVGQPRTNSRRWINVKVRKIRPGAYWVEAIDWDRRLFDELIPLPDGTSYNSYLIQGGEKTALIDAVDPLMKHVMRSCLDNLAVKQIDYLVANHAGPGHSRSIPSVLANALRPKTKFAPIIGSYGWGSQAKE